MTQLPANKIGVVGLWHLGCVLSASWLKLGNQVVGIDFDSKNIESLSKGKPPIFEPHLEEVLESGLSENRISFSQDPSQLKDCSYIFLAYDTPVDENDRFDLSPLEYALDKISPHLNPDSILIISSQLPVGTSRHFRAKLQSIIPGFEIVYSPENLRLGEAIENYLNPGHIVIGADTQRAKQAAIDLFSTIKADYLQMDLPSAEMTKHAINSFLGTSITFANQLSDICGTVDADFSKVADAMRHDPRIGKKAYLKAGVGFSGGTLGRDLQILESVNSSKANGSCPIFGKVWECNKLRPGHIVDKVEMTLGNTASKTVSLLGLTYKPGTSTLRRSVPLEIAQALVRRGANVRVYDPKANWKEANLEGIEIFQEPCELVQSSHLIILLTEWPEFKELDYQCLASKMEETRLFDPHYFLKDQYTELRSFGFNMVNVNTLKNEPQYEYSN